MHKDKIKVPVILGPTAVGKTDICFELAQSLGAEIISCDSRLVYRHMDIGTAKPSNEMLQCVPHWCVNILTPEQAYSAYQFGVDATAVIHECAKRNKLVIVCGGTGMYFHVLKYGMEHQIASDPVLREKMLSLVKNEGNQALHSLLQEHDPASAVKLHPNDVQRVIRALEVFFISGKSLSSSKKDVAASDDFEFRLFILSRDRDELYTRINSRVDTMFSRGLQEEFASLRKMGYDETAPGLATVGYQELFMLEKYPHMLSEVKEKIKQNTRRYAKRQITWFSNKAMGEMVDCSLGTTYATIRAEVCSFLGV